MNSILRQDGARSSVRTQHDVVKRRVCILIPSLAGGGAERATLLLASGLLERGHEVDLVLRDLVCDYPTYVPDDARLLFLSRPGNSQSRPESRRRPIRPQPLAPATRSTRLRFPRLALAPAVPWRQWPLLASTSLPRWAAATAMYLDRDRPDALLAILTPAVVAATLAARVSLHRPRIVASQRNVFKSTREYRRARLSYPCADAAVAVSRGVAGELGGLSGMSHDRIHTVYNPVVSTNLLRKSREPIDHPWLDGRGPPVVLAIGRLHPQKDFPTLLAAFALLLRQRPARLIVLGSGPLLADLRSLAHELRIGSHVKFCGFVENPYAFLARASLFVLSSRHEGLANVLIEAMACGCPVVSTNCPFGPAEILEDGRWGELVPVGNSDALAGAMARALDNPPQRRGLRDRASFFSVEKAVVRYEEILLRR